MVLVAGPRVRGQKILRMKRIRHLALAAYTASQTQLQALVPQSPTSTLSTSGFQF